MTLLFTITMPNSPSWDGKWSGAGKFYGKIVKIGASKKAKARGQEILDQKSWYYNWGDGWGACVRVMEIQGNEVRRYRKISEGFLGYDWMVDNIMSHDSPYSEEELSKKTKTNQ